GDARGTSWRSPRLRVNPRTVVVLATARSAASSSSVASASNSSNVSANWSINRNARTADRRSDARAWRSAVLLGNQHVVFGGFRAGNREFGSNLQSLRALDCQRLFQGGSGRHNPHPGEILKEEFLKEIGVGQNQLARAIGVPGNRVHAIVKGTR